jgi:hypothetical protein
VPSNSTTSPAEAGSQPSGKVGPWSSSWVKYYDRASRRRHKMGGYKRLRAEARHKKRVELLRLAFAGAGLLAIVSICYAILSS